MIVVFCWVEGDCGELGLGGDGFGVGVVIRDVGWELDLRRRLEEYFEHRAWDQALGLGRLCDLGILPSGRRISAVIVARRTGRPPSQEFQGGLARRGIMYRAALLRMGGKLF